jgi:hypothetical protein
MGRIMDEKLTISDFGIDQSQQFEENRQLAPEQFFSEAQSIYNKSSIPINKGVYLSELDTLFNTHSFNRPFADISFPNRIKEAFFSLTSAQSMKTINNIDMIDRMRDKISNSNDSSAPQKEDLLQTFDLVKNYLKDSQYIKNAVVSIGRG